MWAEIIENYCQRILLFTKSMKSLWEFRLNLYLKCINPEAFPKNLNLI